MIIPTNIDYSKLTIEEQKELQELLEFKSIAEQQDVKASFDKALQLYCKNNPEQLFRAAEQLVKKAAQGDAQAQRQLADRLDGMATRKIEINEPSKPVQQAMALSADELLKFVKGSN